MAGYTNDLSGYGLSGFSVPSNASMVLGNSANNVGINYLDLMKYNAATPSTANTSYDAVMNSAVNGAGTNTGVADALKKNAAGGFNWSNAGSIMQGIAGFGMALAALQANKIAGKSLKAQTAIANANLANSTQEYNTALADRANARYAYMGQADQAAQYINNNRLEERTI